MKQQFVLEQIMTSTGATAPAALYVESKIGNLSTICFWSGGKVAKMPVDIDAMTVDESNLPGLVAGLSAMWAVASPGAMAPSRTLLQGAAKVGSF
jgi:hypothetical protein